MRSHFINSSFMFHQDFQTLENNKNTRPSASCFHQLSRVWKPWWNTRPLLWNIASLPCEDSTFHVKAYNYLMFIGVLYHRFRWGISFFIRCKSRSVSTFSLVSANVKARILKEWKLIKGNHILIYQSQWRKFLRQTKWMSKFHPSSQDITTSSKGDQISLITSSTKIRSLFHGKLRGWGGDLL